MFGQACPLDDCFYRQYADRPDLPRYSYPSIAQAANAQEREDITVHHFWYGTLVGVSAHMKGSEPLRNSK